MDPFSNAKPVKNDNLLLRLKDNEEQLEEYRDHDSREHDFDGFEDLWF